MVPELLQVSLIPIFILLNGFFAGAELAILSAQRTQLVDLAKAGSRSARTAIYLKDHPDRFLPTVQIGITIVGSLASAIGGMTLVEWLEVKLTPYVGVQFDQPLALLAVVGFISYLTLVIGELAPKNLALRYPEAYALILAQPVRFIETAAMPAVRLLDWSTSLVLKPFGGKVTGASRVSREELRNVLLEGHRQGAYTSLERSLLYRAIEIMNFNVADASIPRVDTFTAAPDTTLGELRSKIVAAPSGYVVLYDPASDVVHGVLGWREVFTGEDAWPASRVAKAAIYVPESAPMPQAIEQIQSAGVDVGVVVNEYGEYEGILPLRLVIQRQLLAYALPKTGLPGVRPIEGGWKISGITPLAVLREHLAMPVEDSVFYTTIGGFVLEAIGRLPAEGDQFELFGYRFTVTRMARMRVAEVEVVRF